MGTKQQPGQFDCYAALEEDEPFFVLKATDVNAPLAVIVWSEAYRERKQRAGQWNERAVARYCEAHNIANQMGEWRARRRAEAAGEPIPFSVASPQRLLDMGNGRPPAVSVGQEGFAVKLGMGSIYGKREKTAYYGAGQDGARVLAEMAARGVQSEAPADEYGETPPCTECNRIDGIHALGCTKTQSVG